MRYFPRSLASLFALLAFSLAVHAAPQITELMAAGQQVIADEDGVFPDWIELHNPTAAPIALGGWRLTDDPTKPAKWVFPDRILPAGGYIVVFCSEKDRRPVNGELHTNFRLDAAGETLLLAPPTGAATQTLRFPLQVPGQSFDGLDFLRTPTPGAANDTTSVAIARAPEFSEAHGFKAAPFSLTLTSGTDGATIRYTLDGTEPTAESPAYATPIRVVKTSVIRAAAFAAGKDRSPIVTRTYLFTGDVVKQSLNGKAPAGWPQSWGQNFVDYGLDPRIAQKGKFAAKLPAALKDIPSISVVMRLEDLFDPAGGIYANPEKKGREWERPASLELLTTDGTPGFQVNAGLRIRGGASRSPGNPKHSFRVLFRPEYGAEALEYPLFGPDGAARTEKFDLRCEQLIAWHYFFDPNTDFIRDIYGRDTQRALGYPSSRGQFYHLFINGQYWGMYQTDERIGAEYAAEYFGGKEGDYDTVKINYDGDSFGGGTDFIDGTFGAWRRAVEIGYAGLESNENYFRIQGQNPDGSRNPAYEPLIDADNLIAYMLAGIYIAASDSPPDQGTQNNWYSVRSRSGDFGFRFFAHDWEISMSSGDENRVGPQPTENPFRTFGGGPIIIDNGIVAGEPFPDDGEAQLDPTSANPWHFWQGMRMNPEFRLRVADHVQKYFFNNGPLTQENAVARWRARMEEIDLAVIGESARWGDARQDGIGPFLHLLREKVARAARKPNLIEATDEDDLIIDPPPRPGTGGGPVAAAGKRPKPMTRDHWLKACNENILGGFLANRSANMLQHLRDGGLFPETMAPRLVPDGGGQFRLENPNEGGIIVYTLDGLDPRQVGGSVHPSADIFVQPIVITGRKTLRARVQTESEWSPLLETELIGDDFRDLGISEIHYHPPVEHGDSVEFVELHNEGTTPLDVSGLRFTQGITYTFPPGTIIPSGGYFVLVRDSNAFAQSYPQVPIGGVFTGRLSDDGESLTIETAGGARVLSVDYRDDGDWPAAPDGFGFTLVYDGKSDDDDGKNWRASTRLGGSPGDNDFGDSLNPPVRISEVIVTAAGVQVELENTGGVAIVVGPPAGPSNPRRGWELSDGSQRIALPVGLTIPARGHVLLGTEDLAGLTFSPAGGAVTLVAKPVPGEPIHPFPIKATGFQFRSSTRDQAARFRYGPLLTGNSYIRYVSEAGNVTHPLALTPTPGTANSAPQLSPVQITEIQPAGGVAAQFVELTNTLPSTAQLGNARLVGLGFTFPGGSTIPPLGRALVVTGDPEAFRTLHGIGPEVPIFGPAAGRLQENGERVALEAPVTVDATPCFLTIEDLRYNDKSPWPIAPPGKGHSLQRVSMAVYGDEPFAWATALASPGAGSTANGLPRVTIQEIIPATVRGAGPTVRIAAADLDGTVSKVELLVDGVVVGSKTAPPYDFAPRVRGGLHDFLARATDNRGGVGESEAIAYELPENPDGAGSGWRAEFFANADLDGLPVVTTDGVALGGDWFHIDPAAGVSRTGFSVRYSATLVPRADGAHSLAFRTNGGLRLYLNDDLVLDEWSDPQTHTASDFTYSAEFLAGEPVRVVVEYFDNDGFAALALDWMEPNSFASGPIPTRLVYLPGQDPTALAIAFPEGIERRLVGQRFLAQFQAFNAIAPVVWSVTDGTLPPGVALLPDGRLTGAPETPGVYTATIRVEEQAGVPPVSATRTLTIQVLDRRIAAPTIEIRTPGAIVSNNGDVLASGRARSQRPLARIRYSVNYGDWHDLPGAAEWSLLLTTFGGLQGGENHFQVQAIDVDGRSSSVVERRFVRRFPSTLNVSVSGGGTVSAGFLGLSQRMVGDFYTIVATPAPGFLFSRWEGSVAEHQPRLRFQMQENAELIAVFERNPFLSAHGLYTGFIGGDWTNHLGRGRATVKMSPGGELTGTIESVGVRYRFKSRFGLDGLAYVYQFDPATQRSLNAVLQFDLTTQALTVQIDSFTNPTSSSGLLRRVPWTTEVPCPVRGRWNVAAGPAPAPAPSGDTFAAVRVGQTGLARSVGRLADGRPFADSASVDSILSLPTYVILTPPGVDAGESLSGVLQFTTATGGGVGGFWNWSRAEEGVIIIDAQPPRSRRGLPPIPNTALFSYTLEAEGGRYVPPAANGLVLSLPSPKLSVFDAGGVPLIEKTATLRPNHAFVFSQPDPDRTALKFDPKTGLAEGRIVISGVEYRLFGIADQKNNLVRGCAVNPDGTATRIRVESSP